ncbi:hypothetical protein HBI56_155790 [Parastagonospora nodorum]|uniref:Uncharacterized protein n=2 Tax=Phaeosphaeria nodorum (strain SN15 / ATCC MYA-4574 / FGSC 10173) TaxID=321614 RepID=A0A7U2I8P2_PHANO|nr:hypothetical protein HBH56_118480 [Parastagonospora nodorum]QRD05291.1 hypothetical protein JI435_111890 [Parastagonospora nodorum SN15]KAH3928741.1 hypothetical protein HBH54_130710 [Parastagonospora nodorum]KAH3950697.1 hypothetical protein HBH53_071000 [Parastagonospora nodorum]KAH3959727.1 hypothetical protein HBH51_196890 [Parastagonospora nodorum]
MCDTAVSSTASTFPFLKLSLELRLHIYGYIAEAVPRTTHMSEYAGLYLSSHQVKAEFEAEYMRASEPYFTELANTLRVSPVVAVPNTITFVTRQWFNLRIPPSIRPQQRVMHTHELFFRLSHPGMLYRTDDNWNTIKPIFASHLESISLFFDGTITDACPWYEWVVEVLFAKMKEVGTVNTKQVSIMVKLNDRPEVNMTEHFPSGSDLGELWKLKERVKDGNALYYTWTRVGPEPKQ